MILFCVGYLALELELVIVGNGATPRIRDK